MPELAGVAFIRRKFSRSIAFFTVCILQPANFSSAVTVDRTDDV